MDKSNSTNLDEQHALSVEIAEVTKKLYKNKPLSPTLFRSLCINKTTNIMIESGDTSVDNADLLDKEIDIP